jgi:hypothetical protein
MSLDTLEIFPGGFSFQHPWEVPSGIPLTSLRRATDGLAPRLSTGVAAYYDELHLTLIFAGEDDEVVATYRGRDDPIYLEDVVEAFLAPVHPAEYYEIDANPLGTMFDAKIISPDGERRTMKAQPEWNCDECWALVHREIRDEERSRFSIVMRIAFAALERPTPQPGETWRANFFRVDRSGSGDEYSAWQPTYRTPPDFHVPGSFGTLIFRA